MSLFALFIEGLLSFLSPCVLPLVPLYMSYLSSELKQVDENGNVKYQTGKVFLMTVFFVLGMSVIFLILAMSLDVVKPFIEKYGTIISLIGGLIIIVFGLHQTGLINIEFINFEKRMDNRFSLDKMNYLKAFLLGFSFSFAWTPCIGPMLSSAILIASTMKFGSLYILVYALGLIIPFLITGLFTSKILNLIKDKKHIMKYVMIVSGIILILYGGYMEYNAIKELNTIKVNNTVTSQDKKEDSGVYLPTSDFVDQNGNTINFKDYEGKYIMLNFSTTWCSYCKVEKPNYLTFAKNNLEDVACFYVMNSETSGVSKNELLEHIKEEEIDISVIIDEDNSLFSICNPNSYPMLFVADKNGKIIGYVSGALSLEGFDDILKKAKEN